MQKTRSYDIRTTQSGMLVEDSILVCTTGYSTAISVYEEVKDKPGYRGCAVRSMTVRRESPCGRAVSLYEAEVLVAWERIHPKRRKDDD